MSEGRLECDIVMKGGITSGVVYPGVIDVLKDKYTFKSIGGTSAGAIAAAALAAAEYRRQEAGDGAGFERLSALPTELGKPGLAGDSRLFTLFTPSPRTKRLFNVLTAFLRREWSDAKPDEPLLRKLGRVFQASFWAYGYIPLIALVAALALIGFSAPLFGSAWLLLLLSLLLIALLTALALTGAVVLDIKQNLIPNHLGLCGGSTGEGEAFSDWLEAYLNEVAGLGGEAPLTFAHLTPHKIALRMFTTCVSRGIPLTVPFAQSGIYFKPCELADFFSPRVIAYLKAKARTSKTAESYNEREGLTHPEERLYALPQGDELPVIVAVRLSMSFPILFSAVPLYMHRYEVDAEQEHPTDGQETFERAYFIDGGICSNFPIDFFDAPLPSRPTFAINLAPTAGAAPKRPAAGQSSSAWDGQAWVPKHNGQGVMPLWKDFAQQQGFGRLLGYLGAMLETGFTWRDTYQSLAAASRNRICHIKIYSGSDEGGLNLRMPQPLIEALNARGRLGGEHILQRFHPEVSDEGWRNHRWQRFRNMLSAQASFLSVFGARYTDETVEPSFKELMATPPSAPMSAAQRDYVERQLERLVAYIEGFEQEAREQGVDFHSGAPSPASDLRAVTDPTAINIG